MELMIYRPGMSTTAGKPDINERTPESVERAIRKRAALIVKDWRKAKPRLEDTAEVHDAWALGEAWRKAQIDP